MVPHSLPAAIPSQSSTRLPRVRNPYDAMMFSCDQADDGDIEGAILTLQASNDAHDPAITPSTTIPPEH